MVPSYKDPLSCSHGHGLTRRHTTYAAQRDSHSPSSVTYVPFSSRLGGGHTPGGGRCTDAPPHNGTSTCWHPKPMASAVMQLSHTRTCTNPGDHPALPPSPTRATLQTRQRPHLSAPSTQQHPPTAQAASELQVQLFPHPRKWGRYF